MQVKIEVSPEHTPPRAVIYTDRITPEIQRALDILQAKDTPVLAERDGRTFLLAEQEVYMIRVVGGETKLYTKKEEFRTRKRLYEVLDQSDIQILRRQLFLYTKRGSRFRGKSAPENEKRAV